MFRATPPPPGAAAACALAVLLLAGPSGCKRASMDKPADTPKPASPAGPAEAMDSAQPAARPGSNFKIGLVLDVGGLGDLMFNDLAHRGLMRAQRELGVQIAHGRDR